MLRAELEPDPPEPGETWWDEHTRVPDGSGAPDGPAVPVVPGVPVPGRHASRRLIEWLPEPLRGRVDLGPWHLAAVALVLAVALGATAWWIARGSPSTPAPVASSTAAPLAPVSPAVSPVAASAGTSAGASAPSATASVTVDVTGKVRAPGVHVLPAGSRVVDAIAAAGGPRPGVNLSSLNQAQLLVDGEQIVVGGPAPGVPGGVEPPGQPVSAAGASGSAGASGALVNLNTATAEELDTLPGVGPATAQAILAYRQEHGSFSSVNQLLDIQGIGEKTLAQIAPHATV